MAGTPAQRAAAVGVVEHGNSAVLVTVTAGGELLDRRRIDLTDGLPTHPHHHEGSWAVGRYASTPSVTGVESCHGPSRTISAASASRDRCGICAISLGSRKTDPARPRARWPATHFDTSHLDASETESSRTLPSLYRWAASAAPGAS